MDYTSIIIHVLLGVEIVKRQTWASYGCLVIGQSSVAAGLAYGPMAVRPLRLLHNSAAASITVRQTQCRDMCHVRYMTSYSIHALPN